MPAPGTALNSSSSQNLATHVMNRLGLRFILAREHTAAPLRESCAEAARRDGPNGGGLMSGFSKSMIESLSSDTRNRPLGRMRQF
jgi:hypothetical protein